MGGNKVGMEVKAGRKECRHKTQVWVGEYDSSQASLAFPALDGQIKPGKLLALLPI